MSGSVPINQFDLAAPTPQNTPFTQAPIALGLSRPTVPDISEEHELEGEGFNSDEAAVVPDALAAAEQNRLNDLKAKSSGYIESLPVEVKRSVAALQGIQVKQMELQDQFKREFWEIEKKYLELTKSLYEGRNAVISGSEGTIMRRILVPAGEHFSFSFPVVVPNTPGSSAKVAPASGTSNASSSRNPGPGDNLVVKPLYGGGPLPKFLEHSIVSAASSPGKSSSPSSKKSGEGAMEVTVEFWGTPGKNDTGEVFVGVFDVSGGKEMCIGKLAVDVVTGR